MRCPNGHTSAAEDYCDTCGAALTGVPSADPAPVEVPDGSLDERPGPGPTEASGEQTCPNCGAGAGADALFCESCGYDYTTGSMPRRDPAPAADGDHGPSGPADAASPAPGSGAVGVRWVAEVWVDPAWYASQRSPDPLPSPGLPDIVALRGVSLLVGRFSRSRGIRPDVDCGADNGVSRRHAQLTTDGRRWWVEDLQSSNGTFVGGAVGDLPSIPIPVGSRREVDADDRIYLGSWTRIVIRPAEEGEL